MSLHQKLKDIANILRRDVLEMTTIAGSGHPTSCLSCAEIVSTLFFHTMSYDPKDPNSLNNDEFILSKGHAAPILYAALYRAKLIDHHPNSLRKLKSPLEGHPLPSSHLPWVKIATGSLGQGLSVGLGMALAAKLQKRDFRTFVLLGDSEMAEGSNYEAFQLATHYKLDNLVAIVDVNRLGQAGETLYGHQLNKYENFLASYGWHVIKIDGHHLEEIISALEITKKSKRPTVVIAKTIKGKGVSFLEDKEGWHGKTLNKEQLEKALKEIPSVKMPLFKVIPPRKFVLGKKRLILPKLSYDLKNEIATRQAYGYALANLAESNRHVIAIDGEVSNSTYSDEVKKHTPHQFIEAYIAEQNMIGMALGLSKKGFNVFASSFAAFLSRAHDQLRMVALSNPNLTICGSHAGASIGEDGPSQMGLEDIAMFRSLPGSIIFYPSDAISTEKLMHLAARTRGLKYIRITRPKVPIIYGTNEVFSVGEFKILRQSKNDQVVLIGAGITFHESLKAHEFLKKNNIFTSVIDLYCIKPLRLKKFITFIKGHGKKVVVTEDHYVEGGIGEAIFSVIKNEGIEMRHLAVREIPHSGTMTELLGKYKINAKEIVKAVHTLVI